MTDAWTRLRERQETLVVHGVVDDARARDDEAELSPDERERGARFVRPVDRVRFASAHAGLRRVLARYAGVDPAELRFGRRVCPGCGSDQHGPPALSWPEIGLSYNLSHSGEHWLVAITAAEMVGVDVENIRDLDVMGLAGTCCTEAERSYLAEVPEQARRSAFVRCWTRKEAVVKAAGVGITAGLTKLEVRPADPGPVRVDYRAPEGGPGQWSVHDVPLDADAHAAVALPADYPGHVVYSLERRDR